jgi:hypothetical protein
MWQLITDCTKQLKVNSIIQDKKDGQIEKYKIIDVESDQYHVELISINDKQPEEEIHLILTPEQISKYRFEVEVN